MKRQEQIVQWLSLALLAMVVVALGANMQVMMKIDKKVNKLTSCRLSKSTIPLASIPMRLITEDPICAQKLLESMNVTNVRVLSNTSQLHRLDERMMARLRNLSFPYDQRGD